MVSPSFRSEKEYSQMNICGSSATSLTVICKRDRYGTSTPSYEEEDDNECYWSDHQTSSHTLPTFTWVSFPIHELTPHPPQMSLPAIR